jgi:Uma2 family endonuclease
MPAPTLETVLIIRPGDDVDAELLFQEACREYSIGKLEQEANGDILVMAPSCGESSDRNSEISMQLGIWAKKDARGRVFDPNVLFIFPDRSKRSPDASWVRKDKLLKLSQRERREFLRLVPDFVIELMSPSDQFKEAQLKMAEYRRNGVELGWLIHPDRREVLIYRGTGEQTLSNPERVAGEGLMAGFVLEVADIWKGLDF